MSAASSGFELTYKVIPPTDEDLTGCKKGRFLHYEEIMCGTSQKLFSNWWISKVRNDGKIELTPLRGLHIRGTRTVNRNDKSRHFKIRTRTPCR